MRAFHPASANAFSSFSIRSIAGLIPRWLQAFALMMLATVNCYAQGTSVSDPALPRVILPSKGSPQVYVLNADSSLQGFSTVNSSSFTLACGAPFGLSVSAKTSLTLASDERAISTFQSGQSTLGPAVVGRSVPLSGNTCKDTPSLAIGGGATAALLSVQDPQHQRLFVLSSGGGASLDTLTQFSTSSVFYGNNSNTLSQLGQASLDTSGTYTALLTDVDGLYGDAIVTQMRTATNSGGLWVYDATSNSAIKILGPGGVNLPAVGAFILHNPTDGGGGLLVLVNQDGLTSTNLTNPPVDTTPFTIIDLGQLHTLMAPQESYSSTITLPSVLTITSSLGYYAMLGAAYNPINHLLYAVVGGGTSLGSVYREVVSYDPFNPAAPNETVVADASAAPLTSALNTQIALSAASASMQILATDAKRLFSVDISGTTGVASELTGTAFGDGNFAPTFLASNPLLGEAYVASTASVDVLTRPAANKMQLSLDLTAPEIQPTVGDDYSIGLLIQAPDTTDFGLSSTDVTITATPQGGGSPFTLTSYTAARAITFPALLTGTFPSAGIYTLVATFPGDSKYAAATSSPVVVAVAQPLFVSKISATATLYPTGSAVATVTLSGTSYTPTGKISITSVNTGLVLATYSLVGGISNPISIAFTAPPSTTAIVVAYAGDTINKPSTTGQVPFTSGTTITTPTLLLTTPNSATVGAKAHLGVLFQTKSTAVPTGNIQVTAASTANPYVFIGTVTAASAFASGGTTIDWTPTASGTYNVSLYFYTDSNYGTATTSQALTVNSAVITPTSLTLSAPPTASQSTAFNVGVTLYPAGATVTGNITVTAVSLNSNTPPITLGTVTASAAAGATGTVLPATITTAGIYTISASYAGDASYSAATLNNTQTVNVTGGNTPAVTLTPTTASFTAAPGTASAYQNFLLYNTGGDKLNITSIATTGTGFAQSNGCPSSLASGANCTIRVNFAPSIPGSVTGSLVITDSASGSPHTAALTGAAAGPIAVVAPQSFAFINQTIGTGSIARPVLTVSNSGTSPLTVTGVTLSNTTDFEIVVNNCTTTVVVAAASCGVTLEFHPTTADAKSATVSFTTSASTATQTVTLTGIGDAMGACADTDGDGLCDDWEENGVWVRTSSTTEKFVDLPSMGADYRHKDIFIQADYMANADHTHKLKLSSLSALIDAFNVAPVLNQDGTIGIHLHIDCGYDCTMDPVKKTLWGNASAAQEIVEVTPFDTVNVGRVANFDWTNFDAASTTFNASGRNFIFHHLIMAHDLRAQDTTSGISRNAADIPTFRKGASDFIVSLGSWTPDMMGTSLNQAATLMHELGHNLGLQHGGNTEDNYKPNYLSVMNYNNQINGLIIDGQNGHIDYSRFTLPVLDESKLNEQVGMNVTASAYPGSYGFESADHYGTWFFCTGDDPSKVAPQRVNSFTGNVNWNCNQWKTTVGKTVTLTPYIDKTLVVSDVNDDGAVTFTNGVSGLTSFNDWPVLAYKGGAIAGNGVGSTPLMSTPSIEITEEQASLQIPPFGIAITGMSRLHTAPGSTMTVRFLLRNFGQTDDTYSLSTTMQNGWPINTAAPATVSIAAGGQAEVTVTYSVPQSAANGSFDKLIVAVASQTAPQIMDSAQVETYATTTPLSDAVSTTAVNFGSQTVALTGGTQNVVIVNTGSSALSFGSVTTTAEFAQTNNCGTSLAVGASCMVDLTFTPAASGARTGSLTINDGTGTPKLVALTGTGVTPGLAIPALTLTGTPAATSTGQTVTLSVNVATLTSVPTGTATITDGTTQYGQVTLDASGNGTFTTSSLGSGTYSLYAVYSGDTTYRGSNSAYTPLTIVAATPTTATLTTSAAAVASGTSVTYTAALGGGTSGSQPTGSVKFMDGTTVLGTGTLNSSGVATFTTNSLANGTHSITAMYAGDAVFGASTSAAIAETVGIFATSTSLTTTASPVIVGASVMVTATVTATGGTPSGTVTFLDGPAILGTGTLNGTGIASFTTSTLAIGTHSLTAQYAASGNFGASISTAKTMVVNGAPDFSVAANPASLTVASGTSGSAAFTVTPINGYVGTISFSCGTLPSRASCAFAPTQLVFAAASQTPQSTTLTFGTTNGLAMLRPGEGAHATGVAWAMLFPLAVLGLLPRRRNGKRPVTLLLMILAMVLSGAALAGLEGCGSSGPAVTPSTPPGSYTVPVTISDGTTNHSLTYNITVK